ncbi:MAG: pyridoxal phosphate-dependent aminotransferase [Spirochaetes bacterium]|nr:pyridoxal phosphate-dependent aminotransferase [Spirochaetota bacterium]
MEFSKRILKIKPSPTIAVTSMANSLKSQGVDIIGFGAGEPDFDTPKNIRTAAINAIESGKTRYTPSGGIPELKNAVVKKFKRDNNLEYDQSEVIINCGGKHSFYNLMQVLIDEGDEVIIQAPYWVSYPDIVLLAGGKPVIINTESDTGFKITPKQIAENITKKTKAIIINSPSNPTGTAYSMDELSKIAEVIENTDIIPISDDIYEAITFDGFKFHNIANVSDAMKKKTIIINGVSKTYAMTGWRIGYIAGNRDIVNKIDILQGQSTSNPTTISQWAAVEALTGDQSVLSEMMIAFHRRRKFVVDELNSIPGISCYNPEGAFYAFPRVSEIYKFKKWNSIAEKYKDPYKSSSLCAYFMEEARTAVVPGIAFGNDNYFRMSFATSDENLKEGLNRIRDAVEKLI